MNLDAIPARTKGGQRKELARNLFQIFHEGEASCTFVIQNDSDQEYCINYDFNGSTNLLLVPLSDKFSEKVESLILKAKVPPGTAADICQLRCVDRFKGYTLKSKMTTQTYVDGDDDDDEDQDEGQDNNNKARRASTIGGNSNNNTGGGKLSKQQITQELFLFSRKTKSGWELYIQSYDERNAYQFNLDFSESSNLVISTAEGFYVSAENEMKILGLLPRCKQAAASEMVKICDLLFADEGILTAEMKYEIDAVKLSDQDYRKHLLQQAEAVRKGQKSNKDSDIKASSKASQQQQQSSKKEDVHHQEEQQPSTVKKTTTSSSSPQTQPRQAPPTQQQQQQQQQQPQSHQNEEEGQQQHWFPRLASQHRSVKFTPAALTVVEKIFDENMIDENSFIFLNESTLDQLKLPLGPKLSVLQLIKEAKNAEAGGGNSVMMNQRQQQQEEDKQFNARQQREQQQLEALKSNATTRGGNWR